MKDRRRASEGFSGGGSFLAGVAPFGAAVTAPFACCDDGSSMAQCRHRRIEARLGSGTVDMEGSGPFQYQSEIQGPFALVLRTDPGGTAR
jgi:hypothetical protein